MKYLPLLLLPFLWMGCERTVDSENNRWVRNKARLERLSSEYPNLAVAFSAHLQQASQVYQQAEQVSNEEEKINLMAEANRKASPTYIKQLDQLDEKVEKLRTSSLELMERSENSNFLLTGLKSMNVEETIKEAKAYLKEVKVSNEHQAEQVVDKAIAKIDRLQKSVSQSLKKIEKPQTEG